MRYFITLMIVVAMISGCSKEEKIAVVDGKSITLAEFDAYLNFKRLNAKDAKRRETLLEQYLERAALAAAIEKSDVLDKAAIQAELAEFRKQMIISRYFEKHLNDAVGEDAVRNYYNTHVGDYEENQVHVAHILIRTNPKMSEPERRAKLTAAQEAYAKAHKGDEFAKIAEQYSEDKVSAKKGGDLGWIRQGGIDANFSKIAFEVETGMVSEPFETPFGYHVLKVLEAPRVIKKSFEAVAGDIRYRLRNKAKKSELERLVKQVKVEKK